MYGFQYASLFSFMREALGVLLQLQAAI